MSATCNLCSAVDARVLEAASDGIHVVECAGCGVIFLDPFPAFDGAAHYGADYYRPWLTGQAHLRAELWRGRADLVQRFTRIGRRAPQWRELLSPGAAGAGASRSRTLEEASGPRPAIYPHWPAPRCG